MKTAFRALLTGSAAVTALVPAARINWGRLPQGSAIPALSLWVVSGNGRHHYRGPDALMSYRVQIDAYGATYAAAEVLADTVRARLDGHKGGQFQGVFWNMIRDHQETDATDNPYRVSQDFNIIWRAS